MKQYLILLLITILAVFTIVIIFVVKTDKSDYNCSDFTTQKEAQKAFNKYNYDKYKLDGDKDGIPCENLK